MNLRDFEVLSFDCYGTLIDWESGILARLRPWLERGGVRATDAQILTAFGRAEAEEEAAAPRARYPDVLHRVHQRLAEVFGLGPDPAAAARFGGSVGGWPPFPDSPPALVELQKHYRLVVLSNVDRASFAGSQMQLGVEFGAVYTAEEIGSYKPDPRNFAYLLAAERDAGYPREAILHVGQSLYHDHVPASAAKIATCWIRRPSAAGEHGATRPPDTKPPVDFHFASLAELAAAAIAGRV